MYVEFDQILYYWDIFEFDSVSVFTEEEFENSKEVIRSRRQNKDRHTIQWSKDKMPNNDVHNTAQKLKTNQDELL